MTTAHGPGASHGAQDHAHDFDDTPVRALAAGEPRTPGWLPLLGIALFFAAGVWCLATAGEDAPSGDAGAAPAAVAQAEPPARPAAAQPGAVAHEKQDRPALGDVQKRLNDVKARLPGGAPAQPHP